MAQNYCFEKLEFSPPFSVGEVKAALSPSAPNFLVPKGISPAPYAWAKEDALDFVAYLQVNCTLNKLGTLLPISLNEDPNAESPE
jgi:hypothetical protein